MAKDDGLDSFDGFTRKATADGMFNDDQVGWMRTLSRLPREAKCKCGWYPVGECYNCDMDALRARGLPIHNRFDGPHWQLPDGRWVGYREAVAWLKAEATP